MRAIARTGARAAAAAAAAGLSVAGGLAACQGASEKRSFEACEAIGDGFRAAVWAKRHENITVLEPENDQIGRLLTALRDRRTTGADFRQIADRLMSLLFELALASVDTDEVTVTTPEGYGYTGTMPFLSRSVVAVVSKDDASILAEALRRTMGDVEVCKVTCDDTSKAVTDSSSLPADLSERDLVLVLVPVMNDHHRCEHLVEALTQRGVDAGSIVVVALTMSPDVADKLSKIEGGAIGVVSATIDSGVDHRGFLMPGLGVFHERYGE
ncbi:hypothetical protein FNF27_08212 [Cafeteria roenbergensis]|uniref:Phosphoribosyltransferase domain-containing protein n=1 Tax=Cafeteria roenbergensis TaxID=33653 RepID=A0A5A8D990_CAFRO|nr:hypothetical protein FNF27_08212 [Cafeteria roenbergensis]